MACWPLAALAIGTVILAYAPRETQGDVTCRDTSGEDFVEAESDASWSSTSGEDIVEEFGEVVMLQVSQEVLQAGSQDEDGLQDDLIDELQEESQPIAIAAATAIAIASAHLHAAQMHDVRAHPWRVIPPVETPSNPPGRTPKHRPARGSIGDGESADRYMRHLSNLSSSGPLAAAGLRMPPSAMLGAVAARFLRHLFRRKQSDLVDTKDTTKTASAAAPGHLRSSHDGVILLDASPAQQSDLMTSAITKLHELIARVKKHGFGVLVVLLISAGIAMTMFVVGSNQEMFDRPYEVRNCGKMFKEPCARGEADPGKGKGKGPPGRTSREVTAMPCTPGPTPPPSVFSLGGGRASLTGAAAARSSAGASTGVLSGPCASKGAKHVLLLPFAGTSLLNEGDQQAGEVKDLSGTTLLHVSHVRPPPGAGDPGQVAAEYITLFTHDKSEEIAVMALGKTPDGCSFECFVFKSEGDEPQAHYATLRRLPNSPRGSEQYELISAGKPKVQWLRISLPPSGFGGGLRVTGKNDEVLAQVGDSFENLEHSSSHHPLACLPESDCGLIVLSVLGIQRLSIHFKAQQPPPRVARQVAGRATIPARDPVVPQSEPLQVMYIRSPGGGSMRMPSRSDKSLTQA